LINKKNINKIKNDYINAIIIRSISTYNSPNLKIVNENNKQYNKTKTDTVQIEVL